MINYDKDKIKEALTIEDYFQILLDFGGEPEYTSFGILSSTICHNLPGEGSRKLYWYQNSKNFHCFTECGESFDIYTLIIKVQAIQNKVNFDLNTAIRWVAQKIGITGEILDFNEPSLEDWTILKNYDRIQDIELNNQNIILKEYDDSILSRFNYDILIAPWIKENISIDAIKTANIGYYPGEDIITIPHYDKNNRFIGLRGRTVCQDVAEMYGKYRPLNINNILYSHPLGMNLYGLNWAQENIKKYKKAIVVESEKSVLQYMSFAEPIAVACCGSAFSSYQFKLLKEAGAEEIIIAFDKDFVEIDDDIFNRQVKNLINIHKRFGQYCTISFIFDKKNNILPQKSSPTEFGIDTFMKMYKNRIYL